MRRIKGREVDDMKTNLAALNKVDAVRAKAVSQQINDLTSHIDEVDSTLSSQVCSRRYNRSLM